MNTANNDNNNWESSLGSSKEFQDDFKKVMLKKLVEDLDKCAGFDDFRSYANQMPADIKKMFIVLQNWGMLKYNAGLRGFEISEPVISNQDKSKISSILMASIYVSAAEKTGVSSLLSCFLRMKIFSEGPKLFSLSTEKCEALENTLLTVPSEEYGQPFPVVIVEFSSDYISNRLVPIDDTDIHNHLNNDERKKLNLPEKKIIHHKPSFAIIHHCPENKILSMAITMSSGIDITAIVKLTEGDSLDDCFDQSMSNKSSNAEMDLTAGEFVLCKQIFRTMCNLCMLACDFGCNSIADPYREKLLKKNNGKYKEVNEFNALTRPIIYELNQKIKLYEKKSVRRIDSESTGRDVKPHWRRGHWRMQPYGEKKSLRKRMRIPPVFVNFIYFGGDSSDTITNYTL
jgi:hypothetical protein